MTDFADDTKIGNQSEDRNGLQSVRTTPGSILALIKKYLTFRSNCGVRPRELVMFAWYPRLNWNLSNKPGI